MYFSLNRLVFYCKGLLICEFDNVESNFDYFVLSLIFFK